MESFAYLIQRLLDVQRGERRSAKLIAEDEQLIARLKNRILARKLPQKARFSRDSPDQTRFKA
jgi:hypothetical protein